MKFAVLSFGVAASATFMAIGPPAAPVALYMNSSRDLDRDISFLNFAQSEDNVNSTSRVAAGIWHNSSNVLDSNVEDIESADYWWLVDKKFKHRQPYAGKTYPVLRNVKDYGAKGDGKTDDWHAIMKAVITGDPKYDLEVQRCGARCNATSTRGAVIYFPPGEYLISKPIMQYYYTIFTGDPVRRPTIVGSSDFQGIALIDTDYYIPNADGSEWWVNQNNFYRQIRNFIIDLKSMPARSKSPGNQNFIPTGIHWQVSQACTLQNIHFIMPVVGVSGDVTHRGIFMENGSGGFVSDLSFVGGKVGFVAGNQQYTARNLRFTRCEVGIEMLWDWGFTWKNIQMIDVSLGINASMAGRDKDTGKRQSTGSITIIDSTFENVGKVLLTNHHPGYSPSVVIDNVKIEGKCKSVVVDKTGQVFLDGGPRTIESWAMGRRYTEKNPTGGFVTGWMDAPRKETILLDTHGRWFEQQKPQYFNEPPDSFLNVLDFDVKNDASYPNKNADGINEALKEAANNKKILVFPAGVYKVDQQIFVPVGSRIVGLLWPQIMVTGKDFANPYEPRVFVKVGNDGDEGIVEISDMMFTNFGATAGTIFMEWNVHEGKTQGSAAMWDTIFRIGGAFGGGLTERNCHQFGQQKRESCMASTLMLHVTKDASIYLENSWLWVADHDIDSKEQTRINIYGARGILIESQGPSWIQSVSNEHSTLYNWQLSGAQNIYMSQIQSETPYFQAGQTTSLEPYPPGERFADDPEFPDCDETKQGKQDTCREAWALRIINSKHVYLYGGGFYSFFKDYLDVCAKNGGTCQDKAIDTDYSENVWLYSLYTVGIDQVISPQGLPPVNKSTEANGFSTATSAWLLLADQGSEIGGTRIGKRQKVHQAEATTAPCDEGRHFDSLEDLEKEASSFSLYCAQIYALQVLQKMTDDAIADYARDNSENYDQLFGYFDDVFKEQMVKLLDDFMKPPLKEGSASGPGRKFFTCIKGKEKKNCADTVEKGYENWTLEMILDDEEGFFKLLLEQTGIDKFWVEFRDVEDEAIKKFVSVSKRPAPPTRYTHHWKRRPCMKSQYLIPDPRAVFQKADKGAKTLSNTIFSTIWDVKYGFWLDSIEDAVQSLSVPAIQLSEAVGYMNKVKELGAKAEKAEKEKRTVEILNWVFLLVPFAGTIGFPAAGAMALARLGAWIGVVGSVGLSAYETHKDPMMAPFLIMDILLAPTAVGIGATVKGGPSRVKDMAKIRREWQVVGKAGLGEGFEKKDALLQNIIRSCRRK